MTLIELQQILKESLVDAQDCEIIRFLGNANDKQIRELSNIIISAKVKQPKKPQPIKYLTDNWGYTTDINKARVFDNIERAKRATNNKYDAIPHNGGFIVTKPATK